MEKEILLIASCTPTKFTRSGYDFCFRGYDGYFTNLVFELLTLRRYISVSNHHRNMFLVFPVIPGRGEFENFVNNLYL